MAEPLSIQQRIAALKLNQVGQTPPPGGPRRPQPPPLVRSHSTDNEHVIPEANGNHNSGIGNQPAAPDPQPVDRRPPTLPTRPELRRPGSYASQPSAAPVLPPRKPSEVSLERRDSSESISSTISATSTLSYLSTQTSNTPGSRRPSFEPKASYSRSMAPVYDPSNLPALPPKRSEQSRPTLSTVRSSSSIRSTTLTREPSTSPQPPSVPARDMPTPPPRPTNGQANRPPAGNGTTTVDRVPQKPTLPHRQSLSVESMPIVPARPSESIASRPKKSALSFGMNSATEIAPAIPSRPGTVTTVATPDNPPPVPLGSRPNLAQLQASKPKLFGTVAAKPNTQASCLICRDFSAPDQHAARFPREAIPSQNLSWLAHQLTDPFPSATDKARAIFTWLHHNIAYDVESFFSGNLQPSTPGGTIASGLAVCEGYAGLFTALSTHAGLESVVIGGHGKGYGYQALAPGEQPPPFNSGHAWNAVKIDNGEWKLIDPCWGAGHLNGQQQYEKRFNPAEFTMSNDEFGLKHFPKDQGMFFRNDGRILSWEEYYIGPDGPGEPVQICGGAVNQHGVLASSVYPRKKHIQVRGMPAKQRLQFQFHKVCEHWNSERMGLGKPYVMVLSTGGKDGRKRSMVVCRTDGYSWWCDVPIEELGCPGQTVAISAVTTCNNQDARGMEPAELEKWVGRRSMSWEYVASYQLV